MHARALILRTLHGRVCALMMVIHLCAYGRCPVHSQLASDRTLVRRIDARVETASEASTANVAVLWGLQTEGKLPRRSQRSFPITVRARLLAMTRVTGTTTPPAQSLTCCARSAR